MCLGEASPCKAEPSSALVPEIKIKTDQKDQSQLFPDSEHLSYGNPFCFISLQVMTSYRRDSE